MIRYTPGIMANGHGMRKLVSIEAESDGEHVTLHSVSANNLGRIGRAGTVRMTADDYNNRPSDPYDFIVEARWALARCGWDICDE